MTPEAKIQRTQGNQGITDIEHSNSRDRITGLIEAIGRIVDGSSSYQEIRKSLLKMLESDELTVLNTIENDTSFNVSTAPRPSSFPTTIIPTQIEAPRTDSGGIN